jgi:hypothetical protein
VSQYLGVIGRDNQNRIRWGNLLTLPIGQAGLLYVEPVYASPGTSDAASSYPRLIRVAMMYNDRVSFGPTVRDALEQLFGAGAGATATGPAPAPEGTPSAAPPSTPVPAVVPPDGNPTAQPPAATPVPAAVPPGVPVQLSAQKAVALQEVQTALDALQQAQRSGNFADYGTALQRLDDAMAKYNNTR